MSDSAYSTKHQFEFVPETGVCYRTLDFLGYPGYRVGDNGDVQSRRNRLQFNKSGWYTLKPAVKQWGHLFVGLPVPGTAKPTKFKTRFVHALVLLAFVGPCPPEMECRHMNGIAGDNRVHNVRWGTKQENNDDKKQHGTVVKGEAHGRCVLTNEIVLAMRCDFELIKDQQGYGKSPYAELAKKYKTSRATVHKIIKREKWKHI